MTTVEKNTLTRLFKVKKTQLEMIRDRGYIIDEDEKDIPDMNIDTFIQKYQRTDKNSGKTIYDDLSKEYEHQNDDDKIYVSYTVSTTATLGINIAKDFLETCVRLKYKKAILISNTHLSSHSINMIKSAIIINIQHFIEEDLMYNVTRHTYVPKHIGLSREEGQAFLKTNMVLPRNLPIIRKTDPVCKYYDFQTGQIVRIERINFAFDNLIDNPIFYRIVV